MPSRDLTDVTLVLPLVVAAHRAPAGKLKVNNCSNRPKCVNDRVMYSQMLLETSGKLRTYLSKNDHVSRVLG